MIIAVVAILAVIIGINYYISQRVYQAVVTVLPNFKLAFAVAFFATITVLMMLGFVRSMLPLSAGVDNALGVVSAYCMGGFVYLLLFTVVADVFYLVFRLCKCSFIKLPTYKGISMAVVLVLTVITVVYGICHAKQIKHASYEIQLENKTDISDLNIVMISDLHLGAVGSETRLEKTVNEINGLKPDVVCIAGDFFDTDFKSIRNPDKAMETIKRISSTYGVYACLGNHDGGETFGQMQDFLQKCNINVLNDEYAVIDGRMVLIGRLDPSPIGGYGDTSRKPFSQLYAQDNSLLPVVVMDHNPANINTYSNEADLILSGHTHKGQLFPANFITKLIFDVDYGYYQKNKNSPHVIVTSGVGYWGMPMRVGTDCEIVSIKLVP